MKKHLNLIVTDEFEEEENGAYLLKDVGGADAVLVVMNPDLNKNLPADRLFSLRENRTIQKEFAREWHMEPEHRVLVEVGQEKHLIDFDTILYVEVKDRKIELHTRDFVIGQIKMSLREFIQHINRPEFKQCHKACAVNTRQINRIEKVQRNLWHMKFEDSEARCPLTKTYYSVIYEALR